MKQYSNENIMNIIKQADIQLSGECLTEFHRRMELAAERRNLQQITSQSPTAKMNQEDYSGIAKAAHSLLKKFGVDNSGRVSSIPESRRNQLQMDLATEARSHGKTTHALLQEHIDVISYIKLSKEKLALKEKKREVKRRKLSGVSNPRRSRTRHIKRWINELSDIFHEFVDETHTKPTYTWNAHDEKPEGRFLNFIYAAEIIFADDNLSQQALADHIKLAQKV